jgi:hypothetical protein
MKSMWTFSATKGWFRSENSLAEVDSIEEAKRMGFKNTLDTAPSAFAPGKAIRQAIFFQRVKKARVDYLGYYHIGGADFWFYMPNTASFIEAFSRYQSIVR